MLRKKLHLRDCPLSCDCTDIVKCILWENSPRSGRKKQLDPVENVLSVDKIWDNIVATIKEARENHASSQ